MQKLVALGFTVSIVVCILCKLGKSNNPLHFLPRLHSDNNSLRCKSCIKTNVACGSSSADNVWL